MKENVILTKTFAFSVKIVQLSKRLRNEHKEYDLSRQILRSATSIGANAEEAVGGISKKDFSAKLGISYKEARETKYWLRLLNETNHLEPKEFEQLMNDCDEIAKILFTIIRTSRKPNDQ